MKDITHYFTTPLKETVVNLTKSPKNLNPPLEDKNSGNLGNSNSNLNNTLDSLEEGDINFTKKQKRKKRKLSDPIDSGVTQLLDSSVIIVSPNTSGNSKNIVSKNVQSGGKTSKGSVSVKVKVEDKKKISSNCVNNTSKVPINDKKAKASETRKSIDKTCKNEDEELVNNKSKENAASKPNAFQLLMDSRHKIIGANLCGKEKDTNKNEDSSISGEIQKEKLAVRKSVLQNWSERKGASKRIHEDEEIGVVIQKKLDKRAKRLKDMLSLSLNKTDNEEDSYESLPKLRNRKRRVAKRIISTDSDSNSNNDPVRINLKYKDHTSVKDSESISLVDEDAQDCVDISTLKTKENKQTLLNFFGVVNESEGKSKQKSKSRDNTEDSNSNHKRKSMSNKKLKENSASSVRHVKVIDASSQDSNLSNTRTTGKTWRMKIKIIDTSQSDSSDFDNHTSFSHKKSKSQQKDTIKNKNQKKKSDLNNTSYEKILVSSVSSSSSSSESEEELIATKEVVQKKVTKVAPVFVKATPKPKVDPAVIEARKQFLMSGMPSSLKKAIAKQQSIEQREYDVFPKISHVQQKTESKTQYWNLPSPILNLHKILSIRLPEYNLNCHNLTRSSVKRRTYKMIDTETDKIDSLKTVVNQIKLENPNYPVYKSFKRIYEKSGKNTENLQPKINEPSAKQRSKKGSRRSKSFSKVPLDKNTPSTTNTLWTEKYKPITSDDIIGNTSAVSSLKDWLNLWLSYSEEINFKGKRKRAGSTSDSDFESTDGDSRDSLAKLPKNTLILSGPNGSGKTAAVYAICNELGFNVLELNASSKRTGKRLLQELQEATQSHQVRKTQLNSLNFFETTKSKTTEEPKDSSNQQKMCVLLVEDVDVVFEQDDGFLPALSQLVSSSKRPIILTTSAENLFLVQKFISQYDYLSFLPLSAHTLAVWLQLVCLVEGIFIQKDDIGLLLEFNKGDVRKTLLELQYWVISGGQRILDDDLPTKNEVSDVRSVTPELQVTSDHEQDVAVSENDGKFERKEYFQHKNCIVSFETFTDNLPLNTNLSTLWWNIPNILNVQTMAQERLNRLRTKKCSDTVDTVVKTKRTKNSLDEKFKLAAASKFYDSLVLTDVLLKKNRHSEPPLINKRNSIKDSLELTERFEGCRVDCDLSEDLARFLVDGCINEYGKIEGSKCRLHISVPRAAERRWSAKQLACEDSFRDALPLYNRTEHSSVSLDYLPLMRQIARTEEHRVANNTKRGNRFRHYFRDFRMSFSHSTCTLSCNILFNS